MILTIHVDQEGHNGPANGGRYGWEYKLLLKPREGIEPGSCYKVISSEDNSYCRSDWGAIKRSKTIELFEDSVEWACVWGHYESQIYSSRDTWEDVVGKSPFVQRAEFFDRWEAWVYDNKDHAAEWLLKTAKKNAPHVVPDIECAMRKTAKNTIDREWGVVATVLGVTVSWPYSWTGVYSAPIRIALAVQKKYREKWSLRGREAFRYIGEKPRMPKLPPRDQYLVIAP